MKMCSWMVVAMAAALAAGMFLGCKPQQTEPAAGPPQTVTAPPKTAPAPAADDQLLTSPPVRTTSVTTYAPSSYSTTTQPAGATRKYVVKQGDTLSSIARTELGDIHRLKELKTLNPGLESSNWMLKVGQEILVPAK